MTSQLDTYALLQRTWHPELYGHYTPVAVVSFFEGQLCYADIRDQARYRFTYGDPFSGLSHEAYANGYVRVIGAAHIPAYFAAFSTIRSKRGVAILVDQIVKIEFTSGTLVYRHPRFHLPSQHPAEDRVVCVTTTKNTRSARQINIRGSHDKRDT